MKRYLRLGALLVILAVPMAVASTLVLAPGLRYQIFRAVSEAPGILTFFSLRASVVGRDFPAAAALLQRQLDWSRAYGVEQSVQVPSLIENTAFVFGAAALDSEREALVPYLRNLSKEYPKLYRPQLWLGQALAAKAPQDALKALEEAAALVSTDEEIYRAAIVAASGLGDGGLVGKWCERYRTATAGGGHPYQFNPLASGVGMRRVIAEIPRDGAEANLIEYNGLKPGTRNVLEFPLAQAGEQRDIVLHFGTAPSVILKVVSVELMDKGVRTARFTDGLVFQSRHGYVVEGDSVLFTGTYGDRLTIAWPGRGPVRADRILVTADVRRAPLTNMKECGN